MPLKVFIVNGSPRTDFSTAKLLDAFEEGIRKADPSAYVRRVNLYDIDFKGCTSCFACKVRGGKSYLRCARRDGLKEILDDMEDADIVCLGTPVYFSDVTGEMRCFIERLLYPRLVFTAPAPHPEREKKTASAFIYTMNVTEPVAEQSGYFTTLSGFEGLVSYNLGGPSGHVYSFNTYQYNDYGKYVADFWDIESKERQRQEQFPKDLDASRTLGAGLAGKLS